MRTPISEQSDLEKEIRQATDRRSLKKDYSGAFAGALELARRKAIRGEPIDYVKLQWPGIVLDWFQEDILKSLFDETISEIFIKGCTGPGKGFGVAVGANVWFDMYPESRVIVTSSTYNQAFSVMLAEIISLRKKMKRPVKSNILKESIEESPKHYVRIVNPEFGVGETFSGQHGMFTMFLIDEASAVSDFIYDNATKQARMIVALSNPRTMSGWFRHGFANAKSTSGGEDATQTIQTPRGGRRLISVGATLCRNVREKKLHRAVAPYGGMTINGTEYKSGEPISPDDFKLVKAPIPGQLDYARYVEIMSHSSKRHRDIFGEAKFPEDDVTQVIQGGWLDRHKNAWLENEANGSHPTVEAFGLDVALSEVGDATVLASGSQFGMVNMHTTRRADAMQTAGWVISTARERYGIDLSKGMVPVGIDYAGGHGMGVGSALKQSGVWVIELVGNRTPNDTAHYRNKRAEMYGELGKRLDPEGFWSESAWPLYPDAMLMEELAAPEKIFLSDGIKFQISPKSPTPGQHESVKEKINRSPDRADAVVYLYETIRSMDAEGPTTIDRPLLIGLSESSEKFIPKDPLSELLERLNAEDALQDTETDFSRRQQESLTCLLG